VDAAQEAAGPETKKAAKRQPHSNAIPTIYCSVLLARSLEVVGREGFEPSTNWLKANCSTD